MFAISHHDVKRASAWGPACFRRPAVDIIVRRPNGALETFAMMGRRLASHSFLSRSAMKSADANERRGRAAMMRVLLERADQHRAMYRNGLGWVDFVWGDNGKGVAHIIARRVQNDGTTDEQARGLLSERIVATIARGSEQRRIAQNDAIDLRLQNGSDIAILVNNPSGNSWLLTGFEVPSGESKAGFDALGSTQAAPTPAQRGLGADGRVDNLHDGAGADKQPPQLFSRRTPAEVLDGLQQAITSPDDNLLARLKAKIEDWRPAWLGALTLRHLGELAQSHLPQIKDYSAIVQGMEILANTRTHPSRLCTIVLDKRRGVIESWLKRSVAEPGPAPEAHRVTHRAGRDNRCQSPGQHVPNRT